MRCLLSMWLASLYTICLNHHSIQFISVHWAFLLLCVSFSCQRFLINCHHSNWHLNRPILYECTNIWGSEWRFNSIQNGITMNIDSHWMVFNHNGWLVGLWSLHPTGLFNWMMIEAAIITSHHTIWHCWQGWWRPSNLTWCQLWDKSYIFNRIPLYGMTHFVLPYYSSIIANTDSDEHYHSNDISVIIPFSFILVSIEATNH